MISEDARFFSNFGLSEYFRSDTSGLAGSCDMYPSRLNP
jgi:hypothetical protein